METQDPNLDIKYDCSVNGDHNTTHNTVANRYSGSIWETHYHLPHISTILIVNSFIRLLFLQQLIFITHPIGYFFWIEHHIYLLFDKLVIAYHWYNLDIFHHFKDRWKKTWNEKSWHQK